MTILEFINFLIQKGFKENSHQDRYDLGKVGIFFDDTEVVMVGFEGKPGWTPVTWRSTFSLAMPKPAIVAVINALGK